MASSPITRWQIEGGKLEVRVIFLGTKITADSDCSHEIKRCLLLGRKAMTNLNVAQQWPTLCEPMDYTVHGSLRARILE